MSNIKKKELLECWKHFNCTKTKCPGFDSNEYCCWLLDGSLCHIELEDNWIDRVDACIDCEVFKNNFRSNNWQKTLGLLSQHFKNYQKNIKEKQENLLSSKTKLEESNKKIHDLLKELEIKNKTLEFQKNNLEEKVLERIKDLQLMHTKLMQTSKMAAIGRFSAGIAHEINNPLGAIINFSRMIQANSNLEKEDQSYLELISKGLFRIENIVKQILGYSAFNESDIKPVNVNDILSETLAFMNHQLKKQAITINIKLEKTLPQIKLNPAQIQQVFLNILKNSIDSLGENGKIFVTSKFKNSKILISFKDNGKGIKKEVLDKIFEPFFTTKDVGKGTGLGLFICYNIIKLYDGEINIKSKENRGTEVIISLPVNGK